MAKNDDTTKSPFDAYVAGTGSLLTNFSARTAAVAPPGSDRVVGILAQTIARSFAFLGKTIEQAVASAGIAAEDVQEVLDSFGAGELLEELNEQLGAASSPADLAAIGTVLPLIKKIIRFVVDIFKLQLSVDLDKILEFVDELATTAVDFVSTKGAEAMHRSEVRFLEAQFHLDRLTSLREVPGDDNGR